MILTGAAIAEQVSTGTIIIEPFNPEFLEPNSYGFHLGRSIIQYADDELDVNRAPNAITTDIANEGLVLQPGRLYLGSTAERMGSMNHAATLHARLSTSLLGMWIQYSAPLGHCGAVIPWTLEIRVAQPVRVFPGMLIGKIAFWEMLGEPLIYEGRYRDSGDVVASRLALGDLQESRA